ncbi:hypothetical protein Dgeo_1454 [Deinococcus geothermalis DSM 11300]|uniref:Photosystem reaction center subunit H n=1 Tax=Deinococcus geothermalis (strain DSM 11300 / CIP 105573 / AG-3a) TaxID=319795 RepID=Q1IYD5_DEIGD|nr:DUF2382 domain-containing protein [Deinococcus geothermalis]ABF45749.1 hypothetical protein Dgeo_1454 [Deinococcus geothermalis DSM 11300]
MTQNQSYLVRLSDLDRDDQLNLSDQGVYNPRGNTAYGYNGEKIGTVKDALVNPETGRIRYLIVDVGGWFSSKEVAVPVGEARFTDDAVYFDNLTKDQVRDLDEYRYDQQYTDTDDRFAANERVLRGTNVAETDYRERAYRTPDRLQLLEERLVVNKERIRAGAVEIGKHVETTQQTVNVPLEREEVIIERRPVNDARPVEGAVLGQDSQTVRVDLEAERANVQKQAYVTEEIEIGKRTVTENQTVTETVGREVLDVNKTGDVRLENADGLTTDRTTDTPLTDRDRNNR